MTPISCCEQDISDKVINSAHEMPFTYLKHEMSLFTYNIQCNLPRLLTLQRRFREVVLIILCADVSSDCLHQY